MHKPFAEAAKIDEVILSRLMPEEDLFAGLSKIAGDHGIKRGHPFSHRKPEGCGFRKCKAPYGYTGKDRRYDSD
jgi:hypothetical protein